jgi:cytochrome c553
MKLLTPLIFTLLGATLLNAQTTMCFKENHTSMATIEKTALDGGLCESKKSVQEMKKDGWTVDDIKIDGSNYIYVFKKETNLNSVNMAELERKIIERLDANKKEQKRLAKLEMRLQKSASGKKLYINKCATCHGDEGSAYTGNSRDLNKLDLKEFSRTIRDYNLGTYDRGTAFRMTPYALAMTTQDSKNVYIYLKSLRDEKKAKK